jgi:arylsulfatase A-like enzyme
VIPQHGFEHWLTVADKYRSHFTRKEYSSLFTDYHHFLLAHGYQPDREWYGARVFSGTASAKMPEPLSKPMFQARHAAQFLYDHCDSPFVLYVSFIEPHRPYYSPYDDLYPPAQVPTGPQFRVRPPDDAALIKRLTSDACLRKGILDDEDLTTEAGCRKLRAKYLGMVSLVDRAVGQILQALDDSGQRDNTIVVFTSDHGDFVGDHMLFGKSLTYEEALKVPLLIRFPGRVPPGRRIARRFSQIDLVPTLLELLGGPIPAGLHGTSRAQMLTGESAPEEQSDANVFVEWHGTDGLPTPEKAPDVSPEQWRQALGLWRTVISADGWKLNLSPVDRCELYDLNSDPHEQINRFDDPDCRGLVRDLAGRLRAWQLKTGDMAELPAIGS